MTELRSYRNAGADSARWQLFKPRPGDIIISTPQKAGTTLTQRLCALAIFQSEELPQPLDELSPWFDQHTRSDEQMLALIEPQQHRRFLKTHTPLDGVPVWEGVTYLSTVRDPRDIYASWEGQIGNMDRERLVAAFDDGAGLDKVRPLMTPPAPTFAERFDDWLAPDDLNRFSLARHLHHMQYAWERRDEAASPVSHFHELTANSREALAGVATAIGVELTAQQLDELSPFAGFGAMRRDAASLAPNTREFSPSRSASSDRAHRVRGRSCSLLTKARATGSDAASLPVRTSSTGCTAMWLIRRVTKVGAEPVLDEDGVARRK